MIDKQTNLVLLEPHSISDLVMQNFENGTKTFFSYDVFLNFRGLDTRNCFINPLYKTLTERGFRTFKDDPELQPGDKLTQGLFKGIEESRVFVTVISPSYASSAFCLNELLKILEEFSKANGRRLLTVFYHSNPSDVRHQTGCCEQALSELVGNCADTPVNLEKWIEALSKVGLTEFSSWHLLVPKGSNKPEYEYVEEIVREISKHVPYPIGLFDRMLKVMRHLSNYSNNKSGICMVVGICGELGIGKTTISQSIYNFYRNNTNINNTYNYFCFIQNVEEYLSEHRFLHYQSKVFIVFEDVDEPTHLKQIVNELVNNNWFRCGSKIVITTRDRCLLEHHGIQNIYNVKRFDDKEAYKLLGVKIFNSKMIPVSYVGIFERAKAYARGNPFILEVIGSYLSGKSVEECKNMLNRIESIRKEDVKMILQMSFDELENFQQSMLIDIACDLKGCDLAEVEEKVREKYKGVCPKRDIRVLVETGLIKMNEYGLVILHELTQEMVRDNVLTLHSGQHSKVQLSEESGKEQEANLPDVMEVLDSPESE